MTPTQSTLGLWGLWVNIKNWVRFWKFRKLTIISITVPYNVLNVTKIFNVRFPASFAVGGHDKLSISITSWKCHVAVFMLTVKSSVRRSALGVLSHLSNRCTVSVWICRQLIWRVNLRDMELMRFEDMKGRIEIIYGLFDVFKNEHWHVNVNHLNLIIHYLAKLLLG